MSRHIDNKINSCILYGETPSSDLRSIGISDNNLRVSVENPVTCSSSVSTDPSVSMILLQEDSG